MNIRLKNKFIVLFLVLFIFSISANFYLSSHALQKSHFNVSSEKITAEIRIIQLTDLHNAVFGKNNNRLVEKIRLQNPDMILLTGDLIISDEDDISVATELINNLSEIAEVYFSLGNHEIEYMERTGTDITKEYTSAGAIVLDESYIDTEIKGQKIRIGGVYGYCLPECFSTSKNSTELKFMRSFEKTDNYKILLSHLPYAWVNYGFSKDYDVDLIFTGHIHGGQVRLPFVGGVFEPEIGWFPGKCAGIYHESDTTTILSRGLGSDKEKFSRFNNIPEFIVVEISGKEKS